MKNFIELPIEKNGKILLNIGQIATVETIEHVSNRCYIITSIKMDGDNQTYYANCSYEELKQLIENAI